MTTIRYTGPGGVALRGVGELEHGKEYEVDAGSAKQLLKRPDFEPVTDTAGKSKTTDDDTKEAAI